MNKEPNLQDSPFLQKDLNWNNLANASRKAIVALSFASDLSQEKQDNTTQVF